MSKRNVIVGATFVGALATLGVASLDALIEQTVAACPGIRLDIKRLLLAHAMKPLPSAAPLVAALQKHGEAVFGEPIPTSGTPLYTDVRLYTAQGIPAAIYGAGPRTVLESNAKRADEHLDLADLVGTQDGRRDERDRRGVLERPCRAVIRAVVDWDVRKAVREGVLVRVDKVERREVGYRKISCAQHLELLDVLCGHVGGLRLIRRKLAASLGDGQGRKQGQGAQCQHEHGGQHVEQQRPSSQSRSRYALHS